MNKRKGSGGLSDRSSTVGDTAWVMSVTGWTHDKISRLCRLRRIKGAFQAQPGVRGSMWYFRKEKTLEWLQSLEFASDEPIAPIGWEPVHRKVLAIGWNPEWY